MGLQNLVPARDDNSQNLHFLRKDITFADMGKLLTIGTIPAGAQIIKPISGVQVKTVFNSATTTVLDVGTTADGDLYGTDLDVKTAVAFVPFDEAVSFAVAADTTITAQLAETGATATAGTATIVIAYVP